MSDQLAIGQINEQWQPPRDERLKHTKAWHEDKIAGLLLLAFVAIAFAIRVYHLGSQSLWLDEAETYQGTAQQGLIRAISYVADGNAHPPLYYLMLYGWAKLAGASEFSLRFVSVLASVLSILLIAHLGRQLFDRRVGCIAAALLAVSPFENWYAQEARMYTLLSFLALASILFCLKCYFHPRPITAVGYVTVTTAMIYTHYFGFYILLLENLCFLSLFLADLINRRRDAVKPIGLGRWVIFQAIILALFSPWFGAMAQQFGRASHDYQLPIGLLETLRNLTTIFAIGEVSPRLPTLSTPVGGISVGLVPSVFLAVTLLGILLAIRRAIGESGAPGAGWSSVVVATRGIFFAITCFLIAPTVGYLASIILATNLRASGNQYYVIALPAYLLLLANGISRMFRSAKILGIVAGIVIVGITLVSTLEQPLIRLKDNYRGMAEYITERQQSGDAMLLYPGHLYYALGYYYKGGLPWEGTNDNTAPGIDAFLSKATAGHDGAWVVLSYEQLIDPQGLFKGWFDRHGLLLSEKWFMGGRVLYYSLESRPNFQPPEPVNSTDVTFGSRIALVGYDWPATVRSGTETRLKLSWQSLATMEEEYRLVTYLQDKNGRIWAQVDHTPLMPAYNTRKWAIGEYLTDSYFFPIPLGTAPGSYEVRVRLYSPSSGATLKPNGSSDDTISIGQLEVQRAGQKEIAQGRQALSSSPAILSPALAIWQWQLPLGKVKAGQSVNFEIVWQALKTLGTKDTSEHMESFFELVDPNDTIVQSWPWTIGGQYTTDKWEAQEVVRDFPSLLFDKKLKSSTYRLRVRLQSADRPALDLGSIAVESPDRTFATPTPQHPYKINIGEAIDFLGYDLSALPLHPGDQLDIRLYWRDRQSMNDDYKVFAHLLGPDGSIVEQRDVFPRDGARPTTSWVEGEIIQDEVMMNVPTEARFGNYRLELGFYDPRSGQRLAIADARPGASDNAILLDEELPVSQ